MQGWTSPKDLADQVHRVWAKGRILAAKVDGPQLFPLELRLRRPDTKAFGERFEDVRQWIRALEDGARGRRGFGYEIEWADINHRQLGRNRVPARIVVPSEHDALGLIGKRKEAGRFAELVDATVATFPALAQWLARRPFVVLDNADDWRRILDVLAWFRDHPRSNLYVRQLAIPNVDTKFIERRKPLLSELLDIVLERPTVAEPGSIAQAFEQRYGLVDKPPIVRFRVLDHGLAIGGLIDIATPAAHFASLIIPARRVFITENEVNGLTFPDVADSIVVFGLGYGIELLNAAAWMADRELYYWGDIDTHGFAMLDRLRANFPASRSFLMDRDTLLTHRALWVREAAPFHGALARLDANEHALFEELVHDRLGEQVRLEQERVSYDRLRLALEELAGP
jgi:hypothetical protein